VRRIETTLVSASGVFIEHVRKAQGVQDVSWRETEKNFPPGRHSKDAVKGHRSIISTFSAAAEHRSCSYPMQICRPPVALLKIAPTCVNKTANPRVINTLASREEVLDLP
jgi:hypothetical protein